MEKAEKAVAFFLKGFNCAQAILSTYGVDFGIEVKQSLKLTSGFGAGMARLGNTCGAITGAIMVIGLKYGKYKHDDDTAREKTYEIVNELIKAFTSHHGSIQCSELLGYDISTADGLQNVKQRNLQDTLCPKFVMTTAEILEQLLAKNQIK